MGKPSESLPVRALQLLFNLHPGEGKRACLFIILGLLWAIGSYGTFTLSEGLFLEKVGSQALPSSYLASAAGMCLFSTILIPLLRRLSIRNLLLSLISAWVLSNLIFYFLLDTSASTTSPYWFTYKVIGWIIPLSTYIVYWAFVDQYYDLQDAKRFFCLFNATIFLGDALGGAIISFFLHSLGMKGIILIFTSSMFLSLPFIFFISRRIRPLPEDHAESSDIPPPAVTFKTLFKTTVRSKFTLYLLLFYFCMQILAVVTEYNYLSTFQTSFSHSEGHSLTEFLGTCGCWVSLGNMFFAMFLYSRLVRKLGINNIILIAPSFFLAVFSIWFWKEALPVAIFGLIAREGMVYTFDDNNLQLLISGVPTKVKNQVRIFVESFIEPAGMFCSAALLFFFQQEGRFLGFTLSISALAIVIFLRTHYPRAIFDNLIAHAIRFERKAVDWLNQFSRKERKNMEFTLLFNLKNSDEKQQLLAFEYLIKIGSPHLLPRLLNHMGRLSLQGKLKAIELLGESGWAKESIVLDRLERWRVILPHPAIKNVIHFYFARHGLLRPEKIIHDVHSEHLGIKAAAILTLKTTSQFPAFYSLAEEKLSSLLQSKMDVEVCTGLKILGLEKKSANIESILPFLKHSSPTIHRAAAAALAEMAHVDSKEYARPLIEHISATRDGEVRLSCLKALQKFADVHSVKELILAAVHFKTSERKAIEQILVQAGKQIAPLLLELLQDYTIHNRCRLLAGTILGKLDRPLLQKQLLDLSRKEIERAYFYLYHASTLSKLKEETELLVDWDLLKNSLSSRYRSILDFIIQILAVAGNIEEAEVLAHMLHSKNQKMRAQAMESLEKTCGSTIFQLLEPLLDEKKGEAKSIRFIKLGGISLNLHQLLDFMERSPSLAEQIVAIGLKKQLHISPLNIG